jgi:hypothetical protein
MDISASDVAISSRNHSINTYWSCHWQAKLAEETDSYSLVLGWAAKATNYIIIWNGARTNSLPKSSLTCPTERSAEGNRSLWNITSI